LCFIHDVFIKNIEQEIINSLISITSKIIGFQRYKIGRKKTA